MRQLSIEERLARVEENTAAIRRMLEGLLDKQSAQFEKSEGEEIMTVKQLAQFLGLDINIIYAKCAKNDIPHFRIGKQYRFKKQDILKWIKTQKEQPDFSVDEYVNRYMQENILKA